MSAQVERHALWHEVFDVEVPQALQVIARVGADMPHAGLRPAVQRVVESVETVFRLNNDRASHLTVRAQHVKLHGLIGKRLTVTVAQQAVEDHRFTRAIEIAWAKHEELLAVARTPGDIKLRQVEGRQLEVKQRGLAVFTRQNQGSLFVGLKLCVAIAVAFRFGKGLPFVIQQGDGDARLRRTVLQTLGEDVQAIMITVSGQANIA